MEKCSCTCGMFEEMQFPCRHAAIVISNKGFRASDFMHRTYKLEVMKLIYDNHITLFDLAHISSDNMTKPPKITKKVGDLRHYV